MSPGRTRRSTTQRTWIAVAAALTVHVVLLGVMGLVRPQFEARGSDDRQAVELQILPPLGSGLRTLGATPRLARLAVPSLAPPNSPLAGLGAPSAVVRGPPVPSPAQTPAQVQAQAEAAAQAQTQAAAGSYPNFFNGEEPGCGTEDVALLTDAEKVRCRSQIELARARRAQAAADADRAARMAAMRLLPKVDGLPPQKRAAYDAVAAAQAAVREDFRQPALAEIMKRRGLEGIGKSVDANVSARCTMAFGAGARPVVHCPLAPPTGFLTEEARTSPP